MGTNKSNQLKRNRKNSKIKEGKSTVMAPFKDRKISSRFFFSFLFIPLVFSRSLFVRFYLYLVIICIFLLLVGRYIIEINLKKNAVNFHVIFMIITFSSLTSFTKIITTNTTITFTTPLHLRPIFHWCGFSFRFIYDFFFLAQIQDDFLFFLILLMCCILIYIYFMCLLKFNLS